MARDRGGTRYPISDRDDTVPCLRSSAVFARMFTLVMHLRFVLIGRCRRPSLVRLQPPPPLPLDHGPREDSTLCRWDEGPYV